jgi:hypothetical protein
MRIEQLKFWNESVQDPSGGRETGRNGKGQGSFLILSITVDVDRI